MSSAVCTILHASDLQCGRPFLPDAADALVALSERVAPDIVVVSGDLTQRAKRREFALARSVLDRLGAVPVLVTPGNHDVPLYRLWERLLVPYRNWSAFAGSDLDATLSFGNVTFVALNSAAPRRAVVTGRLGRTQVAYARSCFDAAPVDHVRILVVHHHFLATVDGEGGAPIPGGAELLRHFEDMGVDLVLGGHVHQWSRWTSASATGTTHDRAVPLVACGTTTSRRGRGSESESNSLNVIRVSDGLIEVTPHRRDFGGSAFEPLAPFHLERRETVPGTGSTGPES